MTQNILQTANQLHQKKQFEQALLAYKEYAEKFPKLKHIAEKNINLINQKIKPKSKTPTTIHIVIPIYNALEDVKLCLESVRKNTDGFRVKVHVINDGSNKETTNWLREYCKDKKPFTLTEHKTNKGYTSAINTGFSHCNADYIVTLNSDTIVTKDWLKHLVKCFEAKPTAGIVGPLSNAASWQNVPDLVGPDKKFAINSLPPDWTADMMASFIAKHSKHLYPRVPFVNGFCFMIKKVAFEKIGWLDAENFPTGYGEENDYCIRAAKENFELFICDAAYVYHSKSKSFGHERKIELSKKGADSLYKKYGEETIKRLSQEIKENKTLEEIRKHIKSLIEKQHPNQTKLPRNTSILFLLPVSGGGGGVHSIVQETLGLNQLNVNTKIAVPQKHKAKFLEKYADIKNAENIFVGFQEKDLPQLSKDFDFIIGTIYTSMKLVKLVTEQNPNIKPAYYIQDYEPLFSEEGSPAWVEARASYTLIKDAILFAKTDWLCSTVKKEHGVTVKKVSPSIDHSVYNPKNIITKDSKSLVVSAMIRPKTPRRGAARTMNLLKILKNHFKEKIEIKIFGCKSEDDGFQLLERDFEFENLGELHRPEVAALLQISDCFIDLSDYQAFGRTALEAMACGAFAIITQNGGIHEYAIHEWNSIIVDPYDQNISNIIIPTLSNKNLIHKFKINSLLTASKYSIHNAATSELHALITT